MHPGAGGGQPADERGLRADGADRRFREVVDLPGQHAGDAAGAEQGEVRGRLVRIRAGLPVGREQDEDGFGRSGAQGGGVEALRLQGAGAAFADDQIVGSESGKRLRVGRVARLALAGVQMAGEGGIGAGGEAIDRRAHIGEQAAADGGGEAGPDLRHFQTAQNRCGLAHVPHLPMRENLYRPPARSRSALTAISGTRSPRPAQACRARRNGRARIALRRRARGWLPPGTAPVRRAGNKRRPRRSP